MNWKQYKIIGKEEFLCYSIFGDTMKFPNDIPIPIRHYTTFWERFRGMMFQKQKLSYGICFPHCNSVHTFFMRQPIDVIMTDKDGTILYTFYHVKPNRIILPKKHVYYTYEFSSSILNLK